MKHLGRRDRLLVTDSPDTGVGLPDIVVGTDDKDAIGIPDALLHETRKIVAKGEIPLIQNRIDSIPAEKSREIPDPAPVVFRVV